LRLEDAQVFSLRQRGIDEENAVSMIVHGFVKDVFAKLPMEYAVEARALLELTLEGSVG
jgi:Fe-S cluster assembly protein SufB